MKNYAATVLTGIVKDLKNELKVLKGGYNDPYHKDNNIF